MIDLDAIRNNSMLKRDGFYHVMGRHRCVPAAGFDALVAEVERLRAYADLLRLTDSANRIERGAHRREEEK